MVNTSIAALQATANDEALRARFETAVTALGLPLTDAQAKQLVWDRYAALVAAPLPGDETTNIARVYEYAAAVYAEKVRDMPPLPGVNPAAVTDDMIFGVLQNVIVEPMIAAANAKIDADPAK